MKCKILLLENDISLAESFQKILKNNDVMIDTDYDGQYALSYIQNCIYDLIILDNTLPRLNASEIIKNIRQEKFNTPILLLISKDESKKPEIYLNSGANDYIIKPPNIKDFLDKVRSLVQEDKRKTISEIITYGDIELNLKKTVLTCKNEGETLKEKEFQIINLLLQHPEQIIPKQIIIEKIWGNYSNLTDNSIEVYISFLRQKIKNINANVKIRTVRGVGYAITLSKKQ